MNSLKTIASLALLIAPLTGCFVETSGDSSPPPPPEPVPVAPANGTLVLDWSINGTTDPNQCYQSSAAAIAISVAFDDGTPAGTFQQDCTTFATSITLQAGRYTASAELIDANGSPRTTAVPINPFSINGNDQLNIPIDFPASSFF